MASSIAVYGSDDMYPREQLPITEDMPLFMAPGRRIHAAGKIYMESLARNAADHFGLSTCGLRPSVVFGSGAPDGASAAIRRIVEGPAVGDLVDITEIGTETRIGYVYVEDVAQQLEILCNATERAVSGSRFFNSGGDTVSGGQLVELMNHLIPGGLIQMASGGAPFLGGLAATVSGALFEKTFGFRRKFNLRDGITAHIKAARLKTARQMPLEPA